MKGAVQNLLNSGRVPQGLGNLAISPFINNVDDRIQFRRECWFSITGDCDRMDSLRAICRTVASYTGRIPAPEYCVLLTMCSSFDRNILDDVCDRQISLVNQHNMPSECVPCIIACDRCELRLQLCRKRFQILFELHRYVRSGDK